MIERSEQSNPIMSLRQMMDRLLEDAFVLPRDGAGALNVYEEGDNVIVETNLPGLRPEDVEVTLEGDTLTIRAETKEDEERKERNYLIREHRRGSFTRSIRLPVAIDPDRVQTAFQNGVLRLTFPKSEDAKARRIPIVSGNQQARSGSSGPGGTAASSDQGATTRAA